MAKNKSSVIVVPHTHWDREWYLSFEEFRHWLVEALDKVLIEFERDPQFKFMLDGQVLPLLDYLEIRPEREGELRRYIEEGRLLIGPWYVQPDEFLVSGESLIRNLLLGTKIASEFGKAMRDGYVPDAFGHIAQLPQILRGFGIDTAFVMRGADPALDETGSLEFLWEAPEGSRVLCHVMETGYCNGAVINGGKDVPLPQLSGLERLGLKGPSLASLLEFLSYRAAARAILLLNGCDHHGPQTGLSAAIEELNSDLDHFHLRIGTLTDFADAVKRESPSLRTFRGELRGTKRHPILVGVLSARMYLKQANYHVENRLERYAEPLAALAKILADKDFRPFLRKSWELLLQNHAHDSICGTGIDSVHHEMETRFSRAEKIADGVVQTALYALAWARKQEGDLISIYVFNPCPWERRDEVVVKVPAENSRGKLIDQHRKEISYTLRAEKLVSEEVLSGVKHRRKVEIAFQAELPPLGFATFYLVPGKPRALSSTLMVNSRTLENEFYRVTLNEDGRLDVLDKGTGHVYRGLNLLEDTGDAGDEYNFAPPREQRIVTSASLRGEVCTVEDLPWKGSLMVELVLPVPRGLAPDRNARSDETVEIPVRFTISLQRGVKRIEVMAEVDNRAKDHRLRVAFPTGIATDRSIAEDTFWVVERPTRPPKAEGWIEDPPMTHPQKSFVAVEDGERGFAVFNRGLPEYEVTPDGTVYLTLLRCVGWLSRDDLATRRGHAGPPYETPEAQCLGVHRFEYAIYTYSGTWEEAGVLRVARDFTSPPLAQAIEGKISSSMTFFTLGPEGVVLSALKPPKEGDGVIVRVYNPLRRSVEAELRTSWSLSEVWELRLDETPIRKLDRASSHLLRFPLRPGEIKTFRVSVTRDDRG